MRRRDLRQSSGLAAACGLLVVVLVAALAIATVRRPSGGYRSAPPLVVALVLGAGLGLLSLLIVGLLARAIRTDRAARPSLWQAATRRTSLALVLGAFILAAAAPHIIDGIARLTPGHGTGQTVKQSDLLDWQQVVVPIILAYSPTLRVDAVFSHGMPQHRLRPLLGTLQQSEATLAELRRRLQADVKRLRSRPQLARLSASLDHSLLLAQRAQQTLSQVVSDALRHPASTTTHAALGRLLVTGIRQLHSSQWAIFVFSLRANKLGASLSAQRP